MRDGSFMSDFTPAFPYEWVLDPKTKSCISERYLSTDPSEFPAVHPEYVGKKARFGYGIKPIAVEGMLGVRVVGLGASPPVPVTFQGFRV
jgi:carotenoid cleavage dioxygenase-like enzyme